jgi:hypothetical protein
MYKIIPFSETLDLDDFYKAAEQRGFVNNSSKHMLFDCFANEKYHQTWMLYFNNTAVGSVAAHSFEPMGENSYRICARTCVLTNLIPTNTLRTRNQIITHQHVTGQFFIPTCVDWAGHHNNLYITSNNLDSGSQKLVHNIYFPAMEKTGQVSYICEIEYRGVMQSVWKLNVERFFEELNKHPRWS